MIPEIGNILLILAFSVSLLSFISATYSYFADIKIFDLSKNIYFTEIKDFDIGKI